MCIGPTLRSIAVLALLSAPATLEAHRERFYLEQFNVEQLRVWRIHVASDAGSSFAYVRDPSGFIHHVALGEYIGDKNGKVNAVHKCSLVILQLIPDGEGGWVEQPFELKLHDPMCVSSEADW